MLIAIVTVSGRRISASLCDRGHVATLAKNDWINLINPSVYISFMFSL